MLNSSNELRIAIMGSTNGTSIKPLIENYLDHKYETNEYSKKLNIVCVISNKKESGILSYAQSKNIETIYLPKMRTTKNEDYDLQIVNALVSYNVDYVLLVGWMRILTPIYVSIFKDRTINIHPSLLPAFAGMMDTDIHTHVINRGCKITGATIMFIDEGADTGPIIDQESIRIPEEVLKNRDVSRLKIMVQSLEMSLIENTITRLLKNKRI